MLGRAFIISSLLTFSLSAFAQHKHDHDHAPKKAATKKEASKTEPVKNAAPKSDVKRRHAKAHDHDLTKVIISIDKDKNDKELSVAVEGSAHPIIGFEHEAKKPEDKAKQEAALNTLRDGIIEMLGFKSDLDCKTASTKLEIDRDEHDDHDDHGHAHEAEHSEIDAEFLVNCLKSPVGTELSLDFSKKFPAIKALEVTYPAGKQTFKSFPAKIKL